jgi:hypothetical protein
MEEANNYYTMQRRIVFVSIRKQVITLSEPDFVTQNIENEYHDTPRTQLPGRVVADDDAT